MLRLDLQREDFFSLSGGCFNALFALMAGPSAVLRLCDPGWAPVDD
jgi:hypothetical protein